MQRKMMACAAVALVAAASLSLGFGDAAKADGPKGDAPKAAADAKGGLKIGDTAPDFDLASYDGKKVKLSDLKDKTVVLEWFNKDCPFCKKSFPTMKKTSEKYATKGVVWLAIDSTNFRKHDENAAVAKAEGLTYPILGDFDGKVGRAYGAATTPHMFIIHKGKLAYAGAIDDQKDRNYVAEALDALLEGKPVPMAETKPYGCTVKYAKAKD